MVLLVAISVWVVWTRLFIPLHVSLLITEVLDEIMVSQQLVITTSMHTVLPSNRCITHVFQACGA